MFKVEDYPGLREENGCLRLFDPEALRSKFCFETRVMPLPEAGDFRVNLGAEERLRIQRQITARVEASLQVASRDLWIRLYRGVKGMADRLVQDRVTDKALESVISNLMKLIDVLPKLNLTKDAELDELASEVRRSLLGSTATELQSSETARTNTAKAADAIAERMSAYMAGYGATSPLTVVTDAA
jgi:hypothetical protein